MQAPPRDLNLISVRLAAGCADLSLLRIAGVWLESASNRSAANRTACGEPKRACHSIERDAVSAAGMAVGDPARSRRLAYGLDARSTLIQPGCGYCHISAQVDGSGLVSVPVSCPDPPDYDPCIQPGIPHRPSVAPEAIIRDRHCNERRPAAKRCWHGWSAHSWARRDAACAGRGTRGARRVRAEDVECFHVHHHLARFPTMPRQRGDRATAPHDLRRFRTFAPRCAVGWREYVPIPASRCPA